MATETRSVSRKKKKKRHEMHKNIDLQVSTTPQPIFDFPRFETLRGGIFFLNYVCPYAFPRDGKSGVRNRPERIIATTTFIGLRVPTRYSLFKQRFIVVLPHLIKYSCRCCSADLYTAAAAGAAAFFSPKSSGVSPANIEYS